MSISTVNQYFSEDQPLTVQLDTDTDLSSAADLKVKITELETKAEYEYTATIEDSANEIISADIPGGILKNGTWAIQSSAVFNGASYPTLGRPVYINVEKI